MIATLKAIIDYKKTIKLIKENSSVYSKYSKIYPFTTENINGYIKPMKNKTVLVVGASGDHCLNAVLLGAKKIVNFDINRLSYHIINLKIAALKSLDMDDFISYFNLDREDALDYRTFFLLKKELKYDSSRYFEALYKHFNYDKKKIKKLFIHKYEINLGLNSYISQENYKKLKNNIYSVTISFICAPLNKLHKKLRKRYDLILLSNISDYIKYSFGISYLENFIKFIQNKLSKYINKNGEIICAYIYDYRKNNKIGRTDIDFEYKRKQMFKKFFKIKTFTSALSSKKKDAVIIYRR